MTAWSETCGCRGVSFAPNNHRELSFGVLCAERAAELPAGMSRALDGSGTWRWRWWRFVVQRLWVQGT